MSSLHSTTAARIPILAALKAGGALKCSPRTTRWFIVQHSRYISINQREAHKLASEGAVRPHGIDSHGNYVFTLNTGEPS